MIVEKRTYFTKPGKLAEAVDTIKEFHGILDSVIGHII